MLAYKQLEDRLAGPLRLGRRPVAVAFRDSPPPGVAKFTGAVPSGCSFWRIAAEGRTFYTVPSDHFNCPVGSYTHNVALPEDRAAELTQALGLMGEIGYIRMEDIPGVFRLPSTPAAVIYAPLGDSPVDPDVVLFSGRPASVMLLEEAARRAGVAAQLPMLGRPTCMAVPAALAQGTLASAGCIGNRTYTELGDDELYVAVPGKDLERIAGEVETIVGANQKLAEYHRERRELLTR
ncbi:MAG TPA: DUF169 domain-containing protein [Bryobacteraceae bacterium]|nr:DUF169 domain-containing protein [Bryobacteraceae bacterium]